MITENKYYTPEEIQTKITFRPENAKEIFVEALLYVPKSILDTDKVLEDSIFVALDRDTKERAFFLSKQILKGRNVFIFSPTIYDEADVYDDLGRVSTYTVLHEIAHCHLKHIPLNGYRAGAWEKPAGLLAKKWMRTKHEAELVE